MNPLEIVFVLAYVVGAAAGVYLIRDALEKKRIEPTDLTAADQFAVEKLGAVAGPAAARLLVLVALVFLVERLPYVLVGLAGAVLVHQALRLRELAG